MEDREKKIKIFEENYEKYHNDVFRFSMLKTHDRSLSLDITQETFMKFWEYLIQGKNEGMKEKALLYRIARNLIIDFYRKKKSILSDDLSKYHQQENLISREYENYGESIDAKQNLFLLQKLPETYREILILRFIHDLSIREIAQIIKKNENTVSVAIHRSLKKLRSLIEEKERKYDGR